MSSECGVQTNAYLPEARRSVTVFVPTKSTPVTLFLSPGPLTKKLCSSERSLTVSV